MFLMMIAELVIQTVFVYFLYKLRSNQQRILGLLLLNGISLEGDDTPGKGGKHVLSLVG